MASAISRVRLPSSRAVPRGSRGSGAGAGESARRPCRPAGSSATESFSTEARTSVDRCPRTRAGRSASRSTTPNAQTSARRSTVRSRLLGRYVAAVPRIMPSCVARAVSVGEFASPPSRRASGASAGEAEVQHLHHAVGFTRYWRVSDRDGRCRAVAPLRAPARSDRDLSARPPGEPGTQTRPRTRDLE